MAFNPSSFIDTYSGTDRVLAIKDTGGKTYFSFSVCNYIKSGAEGVQLWVLLEGNYRYIITFATSTDAKTASVNLNNAIDTLTPNCSTGVAVITPGAVAAITKTAFDSLVTANTVVPATVYEITDTVGVFGPASTIYTFTALQSNQKVFDSYIKGTKQKAILNFTTNSVEEFHAYDKARSAESGSTIVSDSISTYITAKENSVATVTNSSFVTVERQSQAVLDSCVNTIIRGNSNITGLVGASNVILEGIAGDLTGYTLTDVEITSYSAGKFSAIETVSSTITKDAFVNSSLLSISSSLASNIVLTLNNSLHSYRTFPNRRAEVHVSIPAAAINGYTVTIKDSTATTLYTATDREAGSTIIFEGDLTTGIFGYSRTEKPNDVKESLATITVASDGQTSFPSVLSYTPLNITKTKATISGVWLRYGTDYSISGKSLTWLRSDISLESGEVIQVFYN